MIVYRLYDGSYQILLTHVCVYIGTVIPKSKQGNTTNVNISFVNHKRVAHITIYLGAQLFCCTEMFYMYNYMLCSGTEGIEQRHGRADG